jgi:hypothetical protein
VPDEVIVFSMSRLLMTVAALTAVYLAVMPAAAHAGKRSTNADVAQQLSLNDVYIAPEMFAHPYVHRGDARRLKLATTNSAHRGVPMKVGIISHYPHATQSPTAAAAKLRNFMDFSGVLILVTPKGIGMSSDQLSPADISRIERSVGSQCKVGAADCAISAIHQAVPRVLAIQSEANRNAAIFWIVSVGLFGLVVLVLVLMTRRKRIEAIASTSGARPTPTER